METRERFMVCGVDGSAASQRALRWAVDEAVRRGCTLRVVTTWAWDGMETLGAASSPTTAQAQARQVQDTAIQTALSADVELPVLERLLPRSTPSEALCSAALDAEMLVLGSHGHSPVHDKLVGSTSQRVIHRASCPVVVLPDPRRAERARKRPEARQHSAAWRATPMI